MLSKDEIIERLDDVFRDVFDDDTLEVDENTTADDIEDWGLYRAYHSYRCGGGRVQDEVQNGRSFRYERCGRDDRHY